MEISEAVNISDSVNADVMEASEWADFAQEVDAVISDTLVAFEKAELTEEALEMAMKEAFSTIASKFFVAGVVWRDARQAPDQEAPDFTVVVNTVDFIASLVSKGSVSVRFAMDSGTSGGDE